MGIPIEEAFEAAGIASSHAVQNPFTSASVAKKGKPGAHMEKSKEEQRLFDVVYEAVREAVKRQRAGEQKDAVLMGGGIDIGLPGKFQLVLSNSGEDLSEEEISRYKLAFRIAYESVRQQIEAEKK